MSHPAAHSLKFDSAVEEFERNWDSLSIEQIPLIIDSAVVAGDTELLTELVRVDIDRRYHGGYEVQLSEYLKRFPPIRDHFPAIRVICFEDYRCRKRSGLPCTPHRWAEFAQIRQESWYLQLLDGNSQLDSVARPVSASSTVRPQGAAASPGWQTSETSAAGLYRLDDFELVALLGRGAFSHVYLARQISLGGRYVAVKVVDRPLHEPNHLARLQHTGIIPLYSYHRANGRWILCMPYGGAATLADWMQSSLLRESRTGQSLIDTVRKSQHRITTRLDNSDAPPEEREIRDSLKHSLASWHAATEKSLGMLSQMPAGQLTLWLFGKLSIALAHAHQRNIVHGDLKPANILIRNDGEPALIDFNLSQQTNRGPEFLVGGTLPYMSPEHLTSLLKRSAVALWPTSDVGEAKAVEGLVKRDDNLKNYRLKVERYVREHEDHPTIARLKHNQPITTADLEALETILFSAEVAGDRERFQQIYGTDKPLGKLIREIVGLDPNAAKLAFSEFLTLGTLDADQITFINQIIDHLIHNGTMDPADLFKPPFTDMHDQGLIGMLPQIAQTVVQTVRKINENALVM